MKMSVYYDLRHMLIVKFNKRELDATDTQYLRMRCSLIKYEQD